MAVYLLEKKLTFPPVQFAEPDGLLAVGGDLRPERVLLAYKNGIFPWYGKEDPILWWSPDPRLVLFPSELHFSKSMRPLFNQRKYTITVDTQFDAVIEACGSISRDGQNGTWLVPAMLEAYKHLHQLGFAHSVEVWEGGNLVGGLYGVSLGRVFFGESMFSKAPNASKMGFIHFVQALQQLGFELVDCQVYTSHLASLGAREIPRREFIGHLRKYAQEPHLKGPWTGIREFGF